MAAFNSLMVLNGITGLLAGILLNFMPCVLPIISIKFITFSKMESRGQARLLAFSICGGILFFMGALSITFSLLKLSVGFTYWGFQMQNPVFLAVLLFIVSVFTLFLCNKLKIDAPATEFLKFFGSYESRSVVVNGFISGFLVVIFSASCSGPFIGTAISFALSAKDLFTLPFILFCMGMGLCFPYILFISFPGISNKIKYNSAIAIFLKKIAVILMLLTICFVIYILVMEAGMVAGMKISLFVAGMCLILLKRQKLWVIIGGVGSVIMAAYTFIPSLKPLMDNHSDAFNFSNIEKHIDGGRVVLVKIEASWCLTCKANNIMAFETSAVKEFINKNNVVYIKGDITIPNKKISDFMENFSVYAAPLNVIFSYKRPKGEVLPVILTADTLLTHLKEAKDL